MTTWLDPQAVADRLNTACPGSVVGLNAAAAGDAYLELSADHLIEAVTFLRDDAALELNFLSNLTAVDRDGELEVVYHLQSLDLNQIVVCKVSAGGYDDPRVPSLEPIFKGAHLQEREIYDLFGISFEGHSDLRRMFLWEGFPGYPLRKSFLQMPGNLTAGLPGFSHESGGNDWPVPGTVDERPIHPNQASRNIPVPGDPPRVLGSSTEGQA
jgi:NADH-quinone oxidoreductase subunit C